MAWHEKRWAGFLLRLAGVALLCVAALIARHLFAVADPAAKTAPLVYLLALIGMTSASAGSAMAVLGRHLFDQVELSERWTIHNAARRRR